jgi:hypothetical protein
MKVKQLIFILCMLFYGLVSNSQTTTIVKTNTSRDVATTHKVMIIPFENRLYLSEIDRYINAETKLTAKQIKYSI